MKKMNPARISSALLAACLLVCTALPIGGVRAKAAEKISRYTVLVLDASAPTNWYSGGETIISIRNRGRVSLRFEPNKSTGSGSYDEAGDDFRALPGACLSISPHF